MIMMEQPMSQKTINPNNGRNIGVLTSIKLKTGHIIRKMTFDAPVVISSRLSCG